MRAIAVSLTALLLLAPATTAFAQEQPAEPAPVAAQVDLTKDTKATKDDPLAPPSEAPPVAPYKNTVVIDSTLGAMGFLGQFRKVAPPGPWLHMQLGYELFKWLMLFGEGEMSFTDTSNKLNPPNVRPFPMYGFGGGARFTARFTDRVGAYLQVGVGAIKADVATNALGIIGFRDAESLALYFGARLGLEWYQLDRHFALGLNVGARLAQGFAKTGASRDTPAMLDGGLSVRYAF